MCWTLKSDLQLTLIWLLSDLAGNLWRQHSNGAFATLSGFIVRLCCGAQNCPRQVGESSPASPAAPSRFSFIKEQQHPLGSHVFVFVFYFAWGLIQISEMLISPAAVSQWRSLTSSPPCWGYDVFRDAASVWIEDYSCCLWTLLLRLVSVLTLTFETEDFRQYKCVTKALIC